MNAKTGGCLAVALVLSLMEAVGAVGNPSSEAENALVGVPARDVWRGWLWIPISDAIDESGAIVPGRLPDYRVRQLSSKFSGVFPPGSEKYDAAVDAVRRGHDCPFFSIVIEDRVNPRPNRRLTELAASADRILEGTVVGEHPGLLIGEVGELLEVSVERTVKGDRLDRVLLFYPLLKTIVRRAAVCRQDPKFGSDPKSGDHVVFFQLGSPANERGNLFKPERTEMIFAGPTGELRSPAGDLLPPGMKTLDELEAAVKRLLEAR